MKNKLFLATAIIALAACSDNTYLGDENGVNGSGGAISFEMSTPSLTRAGGKDAATALSNRFIVWGEKNEKNTGETGANVGTVPGAEGREGHLVFENYKVDWTDNSAYTTTSNTKNWEYVGLTPYTEAQVSPAIGTGKTQTIKYWDYNADSYTFTAVSALDDDITGGKVIIAKTTSATGENAVYAKGYSIQVKEGASLDNIFFADRVVINKSSGTDREATNAYGGNVTLSFRNFMSKIRFGVFEDIPGYKVKIKTAHYNSTSSTTNFGVDGEFLKAGTNTAFKVSYYTDNKVKAEVDGTPDKQTYFKYTKKTSSSDPESSPIMTTAAIGETAPDATFDPYNTILPYSNNSTNIKVKIDFTLTSEDTGETIEVTDATAEIPAAYCQWKPNYAYSYILKLSESSGGGLYPITFDAVQITDETGKQETITTVTQPSITTIGVNGTAYSVGGNEYANGTVVYATVMDGSSLVALTKNTNTWLYTVTGTGITEASFAERLIEAPTMNAAQITIANTKTNPTDVTEASLAIQNTVPYEDNVTNNKTIGTDMVAKFTVATGTKYAIVYKKTDPTYVWGTGSKCANQAALDALKEAAVDGKLYTDDQCTTEASYTFSSTETVYYTANAAKYTSNELFNAAGNVYANPGSVATPANVSGRTDETVYYKPIEVKSQGVYAIKIVNCP